MMRAMMGKKKTVQVCEWITTVGTGFWIPPTGCNTVDVCIIAGGQDGRSAYYNKYNDCAGGNGGNGGELINVYGFFVTPGNKIEYTVGDRNSNSKFGTKVAISGAGPIGGTGVIGPDVTSNDNSVAINGGPGTNGLYPFNNNKLFNMCCRGGGGGAWSFSTGKTDNNNTPEFTTLEAYGGSPNGGNASSYYYNSGYKAYSGQSGSKGGSGTSYGSAGGGGGLAKALLYGRVSEGSGGLGHSGCIILMYERAALPTDIVDPATGLVKINWPA